MNWLKRLIEKITGLRITKIGSKEDTSSDSVPEKMHCIRFMTERGEQVAVLLTTDEFERGITRWVDTIDSMPIESVDLEKDERIQ